MSRERTSDFHLSRASLPLSVSTAEKEERKEGYGLTFFPTSPRCFGRLVLFSRDLSFCFWVFFFSLFAGLRFGPKGSPAGRSDAAHVSVTLHLWGGVTHGEQGLRNEERDRVLQTRLHQEDRFRVAEGRLTPLGLPWRKGWGQGVWLHPSGGIRSCHR